MLVNFEKMQGLGNDFVVIDLITQNVQLDSKQVQRIADRHFGIGCDQVILIEPPIRPNADFFYRIFNADGQEVEQCGNGARCAARFFYDMGFSSEKTLNADCLAGSIQFQLEEDETVRMNSGKPNFRPEEIPLTLAQEENLYSLILEGAPQFKEDFFDPKNNKITFSALSIGNPHMILQVSDLENVSIQDWGKLLSTHAIFPKGINIGFMQVRDQNSIRLRVYERGVGETLACGTNAAAAAVAGIQLNLLKSPVSVGFSSGELEIRWEGGDSTISSRGPALSVFAGRFRLS